MLTLSHLNNFLNKGMDNKQEKNYVLCDDATDGPTILALLQHLMVSFFWTNSATRSDQPPWTSRLRNIFCSLRNITQSRTLETKRCAFGR